MLQPTQVDQFVKPSPRPPAWLRRAQAEADRVAEWLDATDRALCVYCGEQAQHEDHLVPRHYSGEQWRRSVPTVPACADCNHTLGDRVLPTIRTRSAYVARQLRAKHRNLLATSGTPDDLDEFGPMLRDFIEARRAKRIVVRSRLAFLDLGGAVEADPSALLD